MGISLEIISKDTGAVTAPQSVGMVSDGALHFDTVMDELYVEIGASTMIRIRPGKELAAGIASLMMKADEAGEVSAQSTERLACPSCGDLTIHAESSIGPVVLDAKPSESGVYLLTPQAGKVRTLRPFEEPVSATYRKHICSKKGANE